MRKRIALLLSTVLLAAFLPTPAPVVADTNRIEMQISIPSDTELSDTGTVDWIKFALHNKTNAELTLIDAVLSSAVFSVPQALETLTIAPGAAVEVSVSNVSIPGTLLGKSIAFALDWKELSPTGMAELVSYSTSATLLIERFVEPVLVLESSVDKTLCRVGDTFTFTYTLKNDTKYDMQLLYFQDAGVQTGEISLPQKVLKAGESLTIPLSGTMGEADLHSKPQVTYVVRNHTVTTEAATSLRVEAVLVELQVEIEAFPPTADGTVFSIRVINTGNKAMTDIRLVDEIGTLVNEAFSLEAGESRSFSFTVLPPGDTVRLVHFSLTAKDCFNQVYSYTHADSFEATPYIAGEQVNLNCLVTVASVRTEENGDIIGVFDFEIRNYSEVEIQNAQVLERNGYIEEPLFLAETLNRGVQSFRKEVKLNDISSLSFYLRAKDATGQEHASVPVEFDVPMLIAAYTTDTDTQKATDDDDTTVLFAGLQDFLRTAGIILLLLCVIGAVVVLVLRGTEKKLLAYLHKTETTAIENIPAFDLDHGEDAEASDLPPSNPAYAHAPLTPAKFRYTQAQGGNRTERLPGLQGALAAQNAEVLPAADVNFDPDEGADNAAQDAAQTGVSQSAQKTSDARFAKEAAMPLQDTPPTVPNTRGAPRTLELRRPPYTKALVWNEMLRVAALHEGK